MGCEKEEAASTDQVRETRKHRSRMGSLEMNPRKPSDSKEGTLHQKPLNMNGIETQGFVSLNACLILPYFGKLPNYFPLWLLTASYNNQFDFLILTDDTTAFDIPNNVSIVRMRFNEVKDRASEVVGRHYVLDNPYKLCDYKPLFGLMFEDYLLGYDYWGHVDPDVIFGDLNQFATGDVVDAFDKIGNRGHLCIYRNTPSINYAAMKKVEVSTISFKDVYRYRYNAHYDESKLLDLAIEQQGGRIWYKESYADVNFFRRQFECVYQEGDCAPVSYFKWADGRVTGLASGQWKEYSYVHLQKRPMRFSIESELSEGFAIVPNEFVALGKLEELDTASFELPDPEWEKRKRRAYRKHQIWNLAHGALVFRAKRLLDTVIVR